MPWHTSFVPVKKSAISVDPFPDKVMPNLIACGPFIRRDFFFLQWHTTRELGTNFSAISIASFLDN